MKLALNFVKLILLSAWVGATLLFGAVVAPAAFGVLRSFELANANEIAGSIVTRCVAVVNITGFIIGLFVLLCFLIARPKGLRLLFELLAAGVFVLATGVGQWVIAARMRALRVAMILPIDQVLPDDPRRIEFNNLHVYSVNTLLLAMIAALVTIILISIRIKDLKIED